MTTDLTIPATIRVDGPRPHDLLGVPPHHRRELAPFFAHGRAALAARDLLGLTPIRVRKGAGLGAISLVTADGRRYHLRAGKGYRSVLIFSRYRHGYARHNLIAELKTPEDLRDYIISIP